MGKLVADTVIYVKEVAVTKPHEIPLLVAVHPAKLPTIVYASNTVIVAAGIAVMNYVLSVPDMQGSTITSVNDPLILYGL